MTVFGYLLWNRGLYRARRIVMAVRYAAIPAVAVLALTGCGSAQTSAPAASLETASQSGAVASADACPANSPVRGILKGELDGNDGVLGHVYNRTGAAVWLWSERKSNASPCRLDPGAGASFASRMDHRPPMGADWDAFASWRPRVNEAEPNTSYWILVTPSPDAASGGIAIGLKDPDVVQPIARSTYRTAQGSACQRDDVMIRTARLDENKEFRLKGSSQGDVLVKRYDDNAAIAKEWTGTDKSSDWARIDLYVDGFGSC